MSHELKSLKHENKQLKNEVQLREDEISYWGMKYDSLAYEKH
jgi:predicted nuclease with TOPRIM domain